MPAGGWAFSAAAIHLAPLWRKIGIAPYGDCDFVKSKNNAAGARLLPKTMLCGWRLGAFVGGSAHIVRCPRILPPAFAGIDTWHGVVPRYSPGCLPEQIRAPVGELSTFITQTGPLYELQPTRRTTIAAVIIKFVLPTINVFLFASARHLLTVTGEHYNSYLRIFG